MSDKNINKIHNKIKTPQVILLKRGTRQNLHPNLSILDKIDCRVVYDKRNKCIFVDYEYDEKARKYTKGIYTTNFKSLIKDIQGYINKNASLHEH